MDSFVDYWFAVELTSNNEPASPKSVYMHKDKGGKLFVEPMWDYDWVTFVPSFSNSYQFKNCLYYPQLFNDVDFISKLKKDGLQLKQTLRR